MIDGNVDWDFSATCHGKGDIDGLGSTCKRRVHEKTLAHTSDLQIKAAVCPGITILHCSKADVEGIKAALENGTLAHSP